jgi:hypothetical protein
MVYVQLFCQPGGRRRHTPFSEFQWSPPFCIFKLQSDGGLFFVEAVQTLDAAKVRVQELGSLRPGESVIHNEATGERVFITAGGDTKN